jgi:hypothetical protein
MVFANAVPLWIVATLGKSVAILSDYVGPCETYKAGREGVLTSIQVSDEGAGFYVTLALDPEDPSYLENFSLDDIRPITRQVKLSVDIENGLILF